MKQYLKLDEWNIIEEGFNQDNHEVSEGIFSIGNGYMGQRANFEETYSGKSLQGSYMAGVYYPDKTRVGWWKNGYPEYFAKVLNSTNWIGIDVSVDGETLDLAKCEVKNFVRILNMKEGYLHRCFTAKLTSGKEVNVDAKRFVSIAAKEIGAIRYSITPVNFEGTLCISAYLDGDIKNADSNYDEKFWDEISKQCNKEQSSLIVKTKKLDFYVCSSMKLDIFRADKKVDFNAEFIESEKFVGNIVSLNVKQNEEIVVYKYVCNVTSRDYAVEELLAVNRKFLDKAYGSGFELLLKDQAIAWGEKWKQSDIVIEGDVSAQQAIRFNIFQLNQTYSGEDDRLNIGPKGFTGEKYGGSTYWDTEAYCIPFYLSTADPSISRNLLLYRYKQLEKAKENARKLGFTKGALYPMVTMNGEECHNEWEITFEEIHRNGAIAYGIYNYVNYTGDKCYLGQYGLEVLVEISRFWEERVSFASNKGKYVILGVTGPNEYENNSNNNWYTNRIAAWTLEYTTCVINHLKNNEPGRYSELVNKLGLKEAEVSKWQDIIKNMYYPVDEELGIFMQQDGYMDKQQILVKDLDRKNLPLNQKWSWDRILRSCFIKQADVLQGIYFLQDRYDLDTIRRNFEFYESRTVHESSLSPCVHTILAAKLGKHEKAYEMYLRTARLDLDNYNNDTKDGCHITSMAGTWMSVVEGFAGMRVKDGKLLLNPFIPKNWSSFSFNVLFRESLLKINIKTHKVIITSENKQQITLCVNGKDYTINGEIEISS
ncbi:glycoside hydrolase family 65 protein [Clostridium sp. CM027]|uniref:glycoside hydrolase family 65 protein n=1 Tax=Clostridium sp. CM027 TaxID=2849865 RepID=UPI001C6EB499|nr:glycoside hydrolase family 65 protein [Clostridium sp. CM027]MBW9146667.1 glycoside hydrolase family 65 protein [Clostridium sp. CM027]UVE42012.1 glycoside hydrolase family 65 protein [Clostridium sp. CM027]